MLYVATILWVYNISKGKEWTFKEWFIILSVWLLLILCIHVGTCLLLYKVHIEEKSYRILPFPSKNYIDYLPTSKRVILRKRGNHYTIMEFDESKKVEIKSGKKPHLTIRHESLKPTWLTRLLWFDMIVCIVQLVIKETSYEITVPTSERRIKY